MRAIVCVCVSQPVGLDGRLGGVYEVWKVRPSIIKMILEEHKCENNIFEQEKLCPHDCGSMILSKRPLGSRRQKVESNCFKWHAAEIQNSVNILPLLCFKYFGVWPTGVWGGDGCAKGNINLKIYSIALSLPCIISLIPNTDFD